jgi:hypothetical protein
MCSVARSRAESDHTTHLSHEAIPIRIGPCVIQLLDVHRSRQSVSRQQARNEPQRQSDRRRKIPLDAFDQVAGSALYRIGARLPETLARSDIGGQLGIVPPSHPHAYGRDRRVTTFAARIQHSYGGANAMFPSHQAPQHCLGILTISRLSDGLAIQLNHRVAAENEAVRTERDARSGFIEGEFPRLLLRRAGRVKLFDEGRRADIEGIFQ